MNQIYNENCINTMERNIEYDYIFCVPPDYDELNMKPIIDDGKYFPFLFNIFNLFAPKKNLVTIGITDRKFRGTILPKHKNIINIMCDLGYNYISQKIWCKSYKQNLYRLNYSHIMSFGKKKYKQNHNSRYEEDVWNNHIYQHKGYKYAVALEVVKRCIQNFTNEKDIVYDPFMGSGTTAIACLELNRQFLGSEINPEYYILSQDRIEQYGREKITLFD